MSPPLELSLLDLGKALKFCRDNANLTQRAVADKGGFEPSYISNLENGKVNPTFSTLKRLAEAIGVDCSKILALEEILAEGRGEIRR